MRSAIGATLFANAHRDPQKQPEPFEPAHFMPYEQHVPKGEQTEMQDEGGVISADTLAFLFAKAKPHG